jgi:hypothetical protein
VEQVICHIDVRGEHPTSPYPAKSPTAEIGILSAANHLGFNSNARESTYRTMQLELMLADKMPLVMRAQAKNSKDVLQCMTGNRSSP